ncbi:hypothetical protein AC579_1961 [Pseudocercospora musae]|uniref:Uncharacterized protein n=1 Tax=Pseudocercospora musae TaxID=113226 RepID=A0A139I834_9PEZI|nr:hypothetical protein AC579_1961 [Pseudocercospora musae]
MAITESNEQLPRRPAAAAYLHLWMPPAPPPSYYQESAPPPAYRQYGTTNQSRLLPTTIYDGTTRNRPRQIRTWLSSFPRLTPTSSTESQERERGCTKFEVIVLITIFVSLVVFGGIISVGLKTGEGMD